MIHSSRLGSSTSVDIGHRFPISRLIISWRTFWGVLFATSAVLCYWLIMLQQNLAMSESLVGFPLLLALVLAIVSLKSYIKGQHDYTLYIYTIFAYIGFIVFTAIYDLTREFAVWGTFLSLGMFDFSDHQYLTVWTVIYVGTAGVLAGFYLAKAIISRIKVTPLRMRDDVFYRRPKIFFLVWFSFAVFIELLMHRFQIGVHISAASQLPFHLTGILFYARNIGLTFSLGIIVNYLYLKGQIKPWVFCLIFIEVILFSYTSLSKKALGFHIGPLLLFYVFERRIRIMRALLIVLVAAAMLSPVLLTINALRQNLYSGKSLSTLVESGAGLINPLTFISTAARRILGSDSIMAVVSYEDKSFSTLVNKLSGSDAFVFSHEVYGFSYDDEGTGLIKNPGSHLFAVLYLSGSLMAVFLGALFVSFIVTLIEKYLQKKGLYFLSLFCAFYLLFTGMGGNFVPYLKEQIFVFSVMICGYVVVQRLRLKPRRAKITLLSHSPGLHNDRS